MVYVVDGQLDRWSTWSTVYVVDGLRGRRSTWSTVYEVDGQRCRKSTFFTVNVVDGGLQSYIVNEGQRVYWVDRVYEVNTV